MITIYQGDNSDISETLLNEYLIKNYEWSLTNIELNGLKIFLSDFEELKFTASKYKHQGGDKYYLEKENVFLVIYNYGGDKFYLDIFTKHKENLDDIYKKVSSYLVKEKEIQISKSTFYIGQQLDTKESVYAKKDFEDIISDYYPDFLDINEFVKQFMESDETIFILSGKAGTGKSKFFTFMMKHLLKHPELVIKKGEPDEEFGQSKYIHVGYLKDENILALDQFWITLTEREYDMVILDDLDYFLSPRSKNASSTEDVQKDKFISQLLSFTDGITKNKTKFLISTNRDIDSVDEALLRPGRLFGIFSFEELTNNEALKIWEKEGLKKKDFKIEFDDKSVLQAKLGSKISEYKNNGGKAARSFLKEGSSIDISHKFKNKKAIGF